MAKSSPGYGWSTTNSAGTEVNTPGDLKTEEGDVVHRSVDAGYS